MATATLQPEMDSMLRGREIGTLNRFVKLKSGSLSLTTAAPAYVDTNALSATATINTAKEDREYDIIIPMGVQLNNYRANPVVLWDHGLGEMSRPIAKCVDPNGDLAVVVTEDEIKATSYFSESIEESMQVFHLIAEQLVKATSVRANPIRYKSHKSESGEVGMILEEWDLVEWSWTAVGCNPDAVAKMLERGTIEGTKICDPLLKSLTAVAPKPADFFKGITLPKEEAVEDPKPDEDQTKTDTPEETTDEPKADVPEEDMEPVADLDRMDEMEDEDMSSPPGAQALASLHNTYRTLKTEIDAATTMVEQPEVRELVAGLAEGVETVLEQIEALDAKTYKGALGKMETTDEEADKLEAVKRLKSWRSHTGNQHRLGHLCDKLRSFGAYNNLTPKQRKEIAGYVKSIRRVENEAIAFKPDLTDQTVSELVEQVQILTGKIRDLTPA